MAKPITIAQMDAGYETMEEASQHLRMNWTDVETEIDEGMVMADWLHAQALK